MAGDGAKRHRPLGQGPLPLAVLYQRRTSRLGLAYTSRGHVGATRNFRHS